MWFIKLQVVTSIISSFYDLQNPPEKILRADVVGKYICEYCSQETTHDSGNSVRIPSLVHVKVALHRVPEQFAVVVEFGGQESCDN
jgi:hypothetical protein